MNTLPALMVAPNGARFAKSDHPELPVTLAEITATAKACFRAGADGLHLHLRDETAKHLLDFGKYREALQELRIGVPDMAVQITTEAAGLYRPDHQMQVALRSGATLVSASIREMTTDPDKSKLSAFYQTAADQGICIQHILYDVSDLALLKATLPTQLYTDKSLQILFVLGKYGHPESASADTLDEYLVQLQMDQITPDWAVCAFGYGETDCLLYAKKRGGKLRVGFENSFWHRDRSVAKHNADRTREICRELRV